MTRFGTLPSDEDVTRIEIAGHGLTAGIITYGASLQSLYLDGVAHPLVLGFDKLAPYLGEGMYFGAIVGRYANRIGHAQARIGGMARALNANFLGKHLLHGGSDGSGVRNWHVAGHNGNSATLSDRLPTGHMGFPGNMDVRVTYKILPGPVLSIIIAARTDAETLCNFAQHSFFNLDGSADIGGHRLIVPAQTFTPVDAELIPTGEVAPVAGTRFDFRQGALLGQAMAQGPLDHNLCLRDSRAPEPLHTATLEAGGVRLDITSTEPGLQLYDGAHLRADAKGIGGEPYGPHAGAALESQLWPDAPHHGHFPSAVLMPGVTYRQETRLAFQR